MNLLKATVKSKRDWWELRLLNLNIVADGATESDMLRDLEHTLVCEYHLARRAGKTPFVDLFCGDPAEIKFWENDDKNFRCLQLPAEVSEALAGVFRSPFLAPFRVEVPEAIAA